MQSAPESETTRHAAVITGIGFLGAGAIVNQGLNIRGLTSASIIFTSAALGVACGAKLYVPVGIVLLFSFLLLLVIGPMERKLFPAEKRKIITLDFSTNAVDEAAVRKILKDAGIVVFELNTNYDVQSGGLTLIYIGKIPEGMATVELTKNLAALPGIKAVSVDN